MPPLHNDSIPIPLRFTKMSGAGNDFVLIDARSMEAGPDWAGFAVLACDRRRGIGADGLLVISPSAKADFTMLYYNADGSYGGMCGNGGRCAARYVLDGLGRNKVTFDALDYLYTAYEGNGQIRLEMKPPRGMQLNKILHKDGSVISYHFVDTGSPHVVIFLNELPKDLAEQIRSGGVIELGRWIRQHRNFAPEGTNVNFLDTTGLPVVSLRTYERGVEDETLACGTGSVASALIAAQRYSLDPPISILTRGGDTLTVDFKQDGGVISSTGLTGPAVRVFEGEVTWDPESRKLVEHAVQA